MKVMHVIDSAGLYGAETVLLNLMSEQVGMGGQPILASIGAYGVGEKPLEREARRRGLPVRQFRMRPGPNLLGLREMLRFARAEKVDVIHSHGYKGNILFGLLPRRIRKFPVVATVHGWTWTGRLNRMMLYEWLDAKALRRVDRVVVVDAAMREHPRLKRWKGVQLEVVPNGILAREGGSDGSQGTLDSRVSAFCRDGFTIGAIGRLSPEKGFDILLEAFWRLVRKGREARLLIIGEGGERPRLLRMVREFGLEERVFLPGYLPSAADYLPLCDLLAISSHTEGLPMVLLEALRAGVPVVSTRVGGIPEVLQNGRAGVLVEAADAVQLAEGMGVVMDGPAEAEVRADYGSNLVRTRYSAHAMALSYHAVYRKLA